MINRYLASLGAAVLLVSLVCSTFRFATRSQVLSGKPAEETWPLEFTIDADSSHTYRINASLQKTLEDGITFPADGPVHVACSRVDITPKDVSWTENDEHFTSPGGALLAHVKWDTPPETANGAHGFIYISFPEIPGVAISAVSFHSGGYQTDSQGHRILREVTTYRSSIALFFARFGFALAAGLPFAIPLQSIWWGFQLRNEKRARLAALPAQGPELPRMFYPDPIAEWTTWTFLFAVIAFSAGVVAAFSVYDGFMSSSMAWVTYAILAAAALIALIAAYFTGRSVPTVRLEPDGLSYARGRGDLQWSTARWSDVRQVQEKTFTYRGSSRKWLELQFNDRRKKLKISPTIVGYPVLRDAIFRLFKS